MKRILVAHDGSEHSDKVLRMALEMAECFGACLFLLTVVPELIFDEPDGTDKEEILKDALDAARESLSRVGQAIDRPGLDVRSMVRHGPPAEKITETARRMKVDMLVVGSHGKHGASKLLLGSVSSSVVQAAPCPVLVVK